MRWIWYVGALAFVRTGGLAAQEDVRTHVAEALESAWVVAIGENHGHAELHERLVSLLLEPRIQALVDDVVVEFGNGLYQEVIDRYVAGEDVPVDSVRMAWRNTVVSPNTVWDSPVYEAFYEAVRRINTSRRDGRRYRLVLADTQVEWSEVSERADLAPFFNRSEHMAETVGREVLRHGRRALLVAGGAHLSRVDMVRENRAGVPVAELSVVSRLQTRYPGALHVIRSLGRTGSLALPDLSTRRLPTVLSTSDPRVRDLSANAISAMRNMDGTPFEAYGDARLSDMADAVILWGSDQRHMRDPLPDTFDDGYWVELNRRSRIVRGQPMDEAIRRPPE